MVGFTADAARLVIADEQGAVELWDVRKGQPVHETDRPIVQVRTGGAAVEWLGLSRTGEWAVTAQDSTVRVWIFCVLRYVFMATGWGSDLRAQGHLPPSGN